ncbi:MAG: hypothetical protein WEC34_07820 [Acidimicrobiia bacterium]
MPDDKDTVERAKEIFVYGPLGLAMYMRDTAPSFLKVFVARGRAEVEQRKKTVGDHLGQVRAVGENVTESGAPQVLRVVSEGLAKVRETAEGALGALSGLSGDAPSGPTPDPSRDTSAGAPAHVPGNGAGSARSESAASGRGASGRGTPGSGEPDLAIAEYDDLSASQVVDRLDGLRPDDLEAIRAYEVTHRARATILGKIEQLTRAG